MIIRFLLIAACLFVPSTVCAELSELGKLRIQEAIVRCEEGNNELTYKAYWKDSVKPENRQAVCLAEKYTDQVAVDGNIWLEVNTPALLLECQQEGRRDDNLFFLCLKQQLMEKVRDYSPPCIELGEENLWDENKCRRLMSYIFIKKFESILAKTQQSVPKTTFSDLSMISSWRIRQAKTQCENTDNKLIYKEYWGVIKPENMKTVCMAERFADLIATDGYPWLETKAVPLIEQCKGKGGRDEITFMQCLKRNLQHITQILSSQCGELEEQRLWDEQKCQRLVSYIFVKEFEKVLEVRKSFSEKFMFAFNRFSYSLPIQILFNPIIAILVLIAYVYDIIKFVAPGKWTHVSKRSVIFSGILITISCFLKGWLRFLCTFMVIVPLLMIIFWNHNKSKFKSKKKEVKIID